MLFLFAFLVTYCTSAKLNIINLINKSMLDKDFILKNQAYFYYFS